MSSKITVQSTFFILFLFLNQLKAQIDFPKEKNNEPCATETPSQQWEEEFQQLIQKVKTNNISNKTQAQVFTIPVIIHVIHGGEAVGTYPNLAQGQINSQIQVLNNDYGGIGFNSGNYPANAFVNYALNQVLPQTNLDVLGRVMIANCNVQFCLATLDTLGNLLAEPGIERINYVTKGWTNPITFSSSTSLQNYINGTIKPQSIWNVSKYLNIWVTDRISNGSLLGYATFPPLTTLSGLPGSFGTSTTDGFWCLSKAFGSQGIYPTGTYLTGYTRGRVSSHEIGHYLGLRHTWGDANCGNDYCDDTPPAKTSNFGSPNYPLNATGSNSCSSAVDGSMFMNIMDYVDDPSKYMLTTDQSTRIQTAMTSSPYRKFLGTHNLCSISSIAASAQFNIPNKFCGLGSITPTNNSSGTPVPNYTWSVSGGALINPSNNAIIPSITFTSTGNYTITLTANNGSTSVISKTISVYPNPVLVINSPTLVCYEDLVTVSAIGGNSYTWLPYLSVGPSFTYIAFADESYTCTATSINGCKSEDSISIKVVECLSFASLKNQSISLNVFPNPASTQLTVKNSNLLTKEINIEIKNMMGQIVLSQKLSFEKNNQEANINISSLNKGIYILNCKDQNGSSQGLKLIKE